MAFPAGEDLWSTYFSTGLPGSGDPTALADVTDPGGLTIGVNPALGGSLGLAGSARWGLSDPPAPEQVDIEDVDIEDLVLRAEPLCA